jgi:hypothetical protein
MSADESAPSGGEESASSGEEDASSGEESASSREERGGPRSSSREPSEEELRAAYEAELSRLTTSDMIAQAIVSLLNIAARRLGPIGGRETGAQSQAAAASSERDLEQVRDAIDAVRPMLEILERRVPEGVRPLRDALAQLQMAYAREVQSSAAAATGTPGAQGAPAPGAGEAAEPGKDGESQSPQSADEPGPAQKSGRLWVPGS